MVAQSRGLIPTCDFLFGDGFEEPIVTLTIPPPVGGINTRDAYAAMPKTDAVWLRDMVPEQTFVETAPPVITHYDFGSFSACGSLIPFEIGGSQKLIATIKDSGAWDVKDITDPGAVTTLENNWAMVDSGAAFWTMFDERLIMCSGAGTPQVYNGTTCVDGVYTVIPSATTLRGCITFKGRVYYWETESSSFWYAAAGAYQGHLTEFPVNLVTSRGGYIVQLASMTRDGGDGADDLFVIFMSTGEVLVYQGDDPNSATSWGLVGKFMMARPIGGRSAKKVGGSLFVCTMDGIADMNRVLAGDPAPWVSDKVRGLTSFRTMPSPDYYADLIELADFAETASLCMIELGKSDQQFLNLGNDGARGLLSLKRTTGAWWAYAGTGTQDFGTSFISASCVLNGVTYFADYDGGVGRVWKIAPASSGSEVFSHAWVPVSKAGHSFSIDSRVGNGALTSTILKDFDVNGALNNTAFFSPFNGMYGQLTMVRRNISTVADFWPDAEYPDKYRWYRTDVATKAGGKM